MPNFYERVLAIPDQILIPSGASMGVWNVQAGAWTKETHAPGVSVQVKVTQGDLAGWHVLQPNGSAFGRI